jgi:hypothetical protein
MVKVSNFFGLGLLVTKQPWSFFSYHGYNQFHSKSKAKSKFNISSPQEGEGTSSVEKCEWQHLKTMVFQMCLKILVSILGLS